MNIKAIFAVTIAQTVFITAKIVLIFKFFEPVIERYREDPI